MLSTVMPRWAAATSLARERVASEESSLMMMSSHCWPRPNPSSDWGGRARRGMLWSERGLVAGGDDDGEEERCVRYFGRDLGVGVHEFVL